MPIDRQSLETVRAQLQGEQRRWQDLVAKGEMAVTQGRNGLEQVSGGLATIERLLVSLEPPAEVKPEVPAPTAKARRRRPA